MKVAHVMAPSPVGGAEQVVRDLTGALAASGVEVHLVPVLEPEDRQHPFVVRGPPGVTVHPVFVPPRRYRQQRRKVGDLIRRTGASVVHTHGYRADVVDAAVARSLGVPTVTTVHGFTGGALSRKGVRNRMYEWLQRRAHRRFSAVVAVSRELAGQLESKGVAPDRLHTIPNARARPTDLLRPEEARAGLGVPLDAFHVGWVGRMSREKAPDMMLDALARIRDRGTIPSFHATFIGDGRERGALEARARREGMEDQVHWRGTVPDAVRFFPAFDVLVLSSRTEGTPVVGLEAMTVGIPLVATRVGGVPDLTGSEGALLVAPEDPPALAHAIEEVHRDPQAARSRAGVAADRVREVASLQEWASRYLAVYRSLTGAAKP